MTKTHSDDNAIDFTGTSEQVRESLDSWQRSEQQASCVELTSLLFDLFCQNIILLLLSAPLNQRDWFKSVRSVLHRAYLMEKLADDEEALVAAIQQKVIPAYFTMSQWRCFLDEGEGETFVSLLGHPKRTHLLTNKVSFSLEEFETLYDIAQCHFGFPVKVRQSERKEITVVGHHGVLGLRRRLWWVDLHGQFLHAESISV